MERLFNYRPEGTEIITSGGTLELMAIRTSPKGKIVGRIKNQGRVVIWDEVDAPSHINDSETDLKNKLIDVINNQ